MGRRGRAYRQQDTGRRLALIAGHSPGMGHAKGGGATSCLPQHLHRFYKDGSSRTMLLHCSSVVESWPESGARKLRMPAGLRSGVTPRGYPGCFCCLHTQSAHADIYTDTDSKHAAIIELPQHIGYMTKTRCPQPARSDVVIPTIHTAYRL